MARPPHPPPPLLRRHLSQGTCLGAHEAPPSACTSQERRAATSPALRRAPDDAAAPSADCRCITAPQAVHFDAVLCRPGDRLSAGPGGRGIRTRGAPQHPEATQLGAHTVAIASGGACARAAVRSTPAQPLGGRSPADDFPCHCIFCSPASVPACMQPASSGFTGAASSGRPQQITGHATRPDDGNSSSGCGCRACLDSSVPPVPWHRQQPFEEVAAGGAGICAEEASTSVPAGAESRQRKGSSVPAGQPRQPDQAAADSLPGLGD